MFEVCPCGSGKNFLACCGSLHNGASATSAEALMRARYSAYARGDTAYLMRSWALETRPLTLSLNPNQVWTGLTIETYKMTGPNTAIVKFRANWRKGRRTGSMTETSRFRREMLDWVYVDGEAE